MHTITHLLVWRSLSSPLHDKNISIMVKICFFAITSGTFALALILFIMQGFEQVTHEKLRSIHPHLIMRAYGNDLNAPHITNTLRNEFPAINGISPTTFKQAIMQSALTTTLTNVVVIKAIDPHTESSVSSLEQKLYRSIDNKRQLADLLHDNDIIIGDELAKHLQVHPGDPVTLLYADEQESDTAISLHQHRARITATLSTGIEEFDTTLVICSFELLQRLWPESGITQLSLNLHPEADEATLITQLRDRFSIEVVAWKDMYPALVSALKLEKYAMFFILTLIVLVACTNIISLGFMHIVHKKTDIALLQTMGMPHKHVRNIFLSIHMIIATTACIGGLLLAGIAGLVLQRYPFISLPDSYYVSYLPVSMNWYLFALVGIVVMVVSFIATWLSTRSIPTCSLSALLRSKEY